MRVAGLTSRQETAIRAFIDEGSYDVAENHIADFGWPLIRSARQVIHGLRRRDLVRFREWIDDEHGYRIELTANGRHLLDRIVADDLGSEPGR